MGEMGGTLVKLGGERVKWVLKVVASVEFV
jgi:hypothetical protein